MTRGSPTAPSDSRSSTGTEDVAHCSSHGLLASLARLDAHARSRSNRPSCRCCGRARNRGDARVLACLARDRIRRLRSLSRRALGVARTSLGAHSVRTAYGSVWCLMLLWWLIGAALGVVVVTVLQWKAAAGLGRFGLVALAVALLVLAVAASAMDPVLKTKLKASEIRPGQVVTPARLHFWQMSWKSAAIGVVEFADQHGQKRYAVTLPDSDGSADERVEEGFVLFDVTSPERPHRFVKEFDPNA